uniref:Cdc23 domain-containing protein n=1 Tax=Mucochytrium quahogii TaxID=96639 RepID=A0A7S2WAH8_9STRA|mmetsp:Transcript_7515/g.12094  ORF Transcript_7515/g.12094 Transcript_7515/m.12094 type:complete len:569 (-) Transcript_7515:766-2472(-)
MEGSVEWKPHQVRSSIRESIRALSSRGLKKSAGWAAEILNGIGEGFVVSKEVRGKKRGKDKVGLDAKGRKADAWPDSEPPDTDSLLIAKSFYDLDEYERCAHVLSPGGTIPKSGNSKEIFLWAYSLYLVGEKRKEEEMCEVADPLEQCQITNSNLRLLRNELSTFHAEGKADGYILYIYGVVLKEMQAKTMALSILCESVCENPLNWSAWLDLASLCTEKEDIEQLTLPTHWMAGFFRAHLALELQQNLEATEILQELSTMFPTSSYVLAQKALAQYSLRNFDEAQELFESLTEFDPHRLQNMDTYSNILYVKECKAELSYLAHTAVRSNKYKPETCCIIGNYFSLKAQHERAVIYFKRALRLNRRYLSAWTLMGHEFVEMKNTEAAIEAYRSAVDINPRDYRAWYGLGQTYEILLMYFYALHYYRKATTLRPYDARMWCALAGCYEKLHRVQEAIKCYKRAECHNDREGIAAQHLATLYSEKLQDREQAAYYYKKHLARREQEDAMGGQDAVEALRFLAGYYLKHAGDLAEAERYCEMLLDYAGPEKKEAEAMLREIRQLRVARAAK